MYVFVHLQLYVYKYITYLQNSNLYFEFDDHNMITLYLRIMLSLSGWNALLNLFSIIYCFKTKYR